MIGTNFITTRFLAAARLCEGFALQTVYSRDQARAESAARQWDAVTACHSLQALADDTAVEAVYIASPNSCHYEQAALMLASGKHVLCEKPSVPTRDEWSALLALAASKGVLLLEAMRPAFLPGLPAIRDALSQIAPVRFAHFPYCQYSSRYDRFRAGDVDNAFNPTLCNGALMDIGVYCLHWMVQLFGLPQKLQGNAVFLPHAIDALGSATGVYHQMLALCTYSKVNQSDVPCRLEGENGTLELSPFPIPRRMRITLRATGEVRETDFGHKELDMSYEVAAFIRLCGDPASAVPFQHMTLDTLDVMDELRAQTGIDFQYKN